MLLEAADGTRKVFFLHVPKTGGVSLCSLLRGFSRPEEICPPPTGDGRWRHRVSDVAHYKLFMGHFDTDFMDAVDPSGVKITILRDPRTRIISTYDFWRSISPNWDQNLAEVDDDAPSYARSVTFSEFLNTDVDWVLDGISNSAARQLLGSSYPSFVQDEAGAIREASRRLEGFDWFTTTERLSEDLPFLARYFGVQLPAGTMIHLNRTYGYEPVANRPLISRTIPTESDLAKIDRLNAIDTALYRIAVKRDCRLSS